MSLTDQVLKLISSSAVIIARAHLDELIADTGPGHNDDGYLALHTQPYLIEYVKNCICYKNADNFATVDSLCPLLALGYFDAQVDFELDLSAPLQVLLWVVFIVQEVLSRKRWVCPLASSVPSTCDGFILGNFISP